MSPFPGPRGAALCCLAVLFVFPFPGSAAEKGDTRAGFARSREAGPESRMAGRRFTASRAFAGSVSRDDAALVAETAAKNAAMRSVMRDLASLPAVRVAVASPSSGNRLDLAALAHATVQARVILVGRSRKHATVTVTVALAEPAGPPLEARIREALIRPDRLDRYAEAALRETGLVAAFDALLPVRENGALPQDGEASAHALRVVNELRAVAIYKEMLPRHDGIWLDPAAAREAMLRALALAPDSALARNAMGDALLQLGRSQEAFEEQTLALRAEPRFARAWHSRGTAALALGHLSSAVADFSEAIRLSPQTAASYRDRGMARHLLGETGAMCGDLHTACALGDCDEYRWAAASGFCSPPE